MDTVLHRNFSNLISIDTELSAMADTSILERLILYRKQIRISGFIALVLGLVFIVAGIGGIQVILGDSWLNYLAGAVLLVLAYFMLQ